MRGVRWGTIFPYPLGTYNFIFRILVPLYDPDTHMTFLCGKGDRNIQFIELAAQEPYIVEGLKYSGDQTKGTCMVPKRAMNVMEGEVNRLLQLCDSSIVPISWQVPRKVCYPQLSVR